MRGFSLVFAGLAPAVAAVIDDAVIHVDRVRTHPDERRGGGPRVSAAAVVRAGATEMRYATAFIVLAVPALSIEGVAGAFVAPLIRSHPIAIAASVLVALVTPAVSLSLLSKGPGDAHPSPLLRWRRGSSRGSIRRRFRTRSPARRSRPGSREV